MTEIEEKVVQIISQVLANNDKGMIFELVSADENNRLPGNEEVKGGMSDEYNAEDEASMADNNSSCFNFRFISHTTKISNHGKGMAIDINPLYNPYIKTVNGNLNIEPAKLIGVLKGMDEAVKWPQKIRYMPRVRETRK